MKTIRQLLQLAFLLTVATHANAQDVKQNIKGQVSDKQSKELLIGATVVVLGTQPALGTTTDINGKFNIANVPPGRYDLKVSYLGYKEIVLSNIQVNSGKEVYLE